MGMIRGDWAAEPPAMLLVNEIMSIAEGAE